MVCAPARALDCAASVVAKSTPFSVMAGVTRLEHFTAPKLPVPPAVTPPRSDKVVHERGPKAPVPAAEMVAALTEPLAARLVHERPVRALFPVTFTPAHDTCPVQDTEPNEPVPPHESDPGVVKLAQETGPKEPVPPAEMPPVADSCVAAMAPLAVRLLHATDPNEPVPPNAVSAVQDTGPPNDPVPAHEIDPAVKVPGSDRVLHERGPKARVPAAEMVAALTEQLAARLVHVRPARALFPVAFMPAHDTGPVQDTTPNDPVPEHETTGDAKLAQVTGPKKLTPLAETPPVAEIESAAIAPLAVRLLQDTGPNAPVPDADTLVQDTKPKEPVSFSKSSQL